MNAFVRYGSYFALKLYYNLTIEGWENVPENEGVIIASNHRSYCDPVLLTIPMKKPVAYMAKKELFKNKFFGWMISKLGAFPVSRGSGDLSIIDDCSSKLKSGSSVVIFPEGTRTRTNKVARGKNGVVLVAAQSGADVLPVAICFEGKLRPRRRIIVSIGKVIPASELCSDEPYPKDVKLAKEKIMSAITELVEDARPRLTKKGKKVVASDNAPKLESSSNDET